MGISLLDRERRNGKIDLIYGFGMLLFFLYYLHVMVTFPTPYTPYPALTWYWAAGAAVTTVLGKRWKSLSFWTMAALLLMIVLRVSLVTAEFANKSIIMRYVCQFVFLFFVAYAIPFVLKENRLKTFLKVLATAWIIAMVVLCAFGIYAAVTNTRIYNLSPERHDYKGFFGFYEGRLLLIQMCIVSAAMLSFSILLSFWCCHVYQKKPVKVLFALTVPLFLFTIGLTDSRAEFITSGFVLGAVACVYLYHRLQNSPKFLRSRKPYGRKGLATALCLFLGLVILIGTVVGIRESMRAYNQVIEHGVFSAAEAEAAEETDDEEAEEMIQITPATNTGNGQIANRSFFDADINIMLNGRPAIWAGAYNAVVNNPSILYKGLSIYKYMKTVYPANAHTHNILIQYLITGGIPALAFYLILLIPFFVRAFRLFFRPGVEMWKRLIPILPMSLFIGDMVDCLTWPKDANGAFFFLFLGATVALGSKKALLRSAGAEAAEPMPRKKPIGLRIAGIALIAILYAGTVFVGSGYADRIFRPTKAEIFGDWLKTVAEENILEKDNELRYVIYLGDGEYTEEDLAGIKAAAKQTLGTKHIDFLRAGEAAKWNKKKARKFDVMILYDYDSTMEAWLISRHWSTPASDVYYIPPESE